MDRRLRHGSHSGNANTYIALAGTDVVITASGKLRAGPWIRRLRRESHSGNANTYTALVRPPPTGAARYCRPPTA